MWSVTVLYHLVCNYHVVSDFVASPGQWLCCITWSVTITWSVRVLYHLVSDCLYHLVNDCLYHLVRCPNGCRSWSCRTTQPTLWSWREWWSSSAHCSRPALSASAVAGSLTTVMVIFAVSVLGSAKGADAWLVEILKVNWTKLLPLLGSEKYYQQTFSVLYW